MRKFYYLLLVFIFSGCATIGIIEFDKRYGPSDINNRLVVPEVTPQQHAQFTRDIQPILENRCVVCHGCYDAPCQLKLESRAGLERGASKVKVYNGERLGTAKNNHSLSTTSKFTHDDLAELRNDGFFAVLNERQQTPIANKNSGLMYQMLQLKQQHPLPDDKILDDSFDLALDREQQCPTVEEFERYKAKYPLAGMPYALPELSDNEHNTLTTWLENGALLPEPKPVNDHDKIIIDTWEKWLNEDSKKQQLVSRYLYEHLYLANLYFQKNSNHYFKLVRSSTPPKQPVKIIHSRRPFDAPFAKSNTNNTARVYYRLLQNNDTIIAKRHMPYRFDLAKLAYLDELFLSPQYKVEQLPDYQLINASNPFVTFKDIPAKSRYRFLLEQAQFSIMNFIKGPVCRGQIALNVIEDHFWVFFTDPSYIDHFQSEGFIDKNSDLLQLPAGTSDKTLSLMYWNSYAKKQQQFLKNKLQFIEKIGFNQRDIDLDLIWSGNGNPNATLTVFRHFDSASVLQGFVGQTPKTAWLISYPLLERIHYLLVAGFDVYGNVGHQLKTRLYMDFLRMEAESNFISFLPKKDRRSIHEYWYRDTSDTIKDYIFSDDFVQIPETNIQYKTNQPQAELLSMIAEHTENKSVNTHSLNSQNANPNDYKLKRLNNLKGLSVNILPQVSYLMVTGSSGDYVYSLINNNEHTNVAHLFSEESRREPEKDYLTVTAGIIGTYPNAFFSVTEQELGEFVSAISLLKTEADYTLLKDKFAIRRTNKSFWQFADKLHIWYNKNQPDSAGLLDFNRLENR